LDIGHRRFPAHPKQALGALLLVGGDRRRDDVAERRAGGCRCHSRREEQEQTPATGHQLPFFR
jgi:hypothetical protein